MIVFFVVLCVWLCDCCFVPLLICFFVLVCLCAWLFFILFLLIYSLGEVCCLCVFGVFVCLLDCLLACVFACVLVVLGLFV